MSDSKIETEVIESFRQRVCNKLTSLTYKKELFCYLLIEELLLLLDVQAIKIEIKDDNNANSMDSNITKIEIRHLLNLKKTEEIKTESICYSSFNAGINFTKSDLKTVNREVEITINLEDIIFKLQFWFAYENHQNFCNQVFLKVLEYEIYIILRKYLDTKSKQKSNITEKEIVESSSKNIYQPKHFIRRKIDFFERNRYTKRFNFYQYTEYFGALNELLERILDVISHKNDFTYAGDFIFSYRSESEINHISLLLTKRQIDTALNREVSPLSVDDIKSLMTFRFAEQVGLSGYILLTGHSEFCAKPAEDNRWKKDTSESSTNMQMALGKYHNSTSNCPSIPIQENIFLLPLCVRIDNSGNNKLLLAVECKLSGTNIEKLNIRKRLFDVAWTFMPFVEAAITTQEVIENNLELRKNRDKSLAKSLTQEQRKISHNFLNPMLSNINDIVEIIGEDNAAIKNKLAEIKGTITDCKKQLSEKVTLYSDSISFVKLSFDVLSKRIVTDNRININVPKPDTCVETAEETLISILKNLISNSVDAIGSREKGNINVNITINKESDCLDIDIYDNGGGINNKELKKRQQEIKTILKGREVKTQIGSDKTHGTGFGLISVANDLYYLWKEKITNDSTINYYSINNYEEGLLVKIKFPCIITN